MRANYSTKPATIEFTDKLTAAFKMMRKMGLLARQNFSCCGSCGSYELAQKANEKKNKPLGYAFYHRQDNESMLKGNDLYIGYGDVVIEATAVATMIVAALKAAGLTAEWDGNEQTRVKVVVF